MNKEQLTKAFTAFGGIIDVRQLKLTSDIDNCLTFIQYEDHDSAKRAIVECDKSYSARPAFNRRLTPQEPLTPKVQQTLQAPLPVPQAQTADPSPAPNEQEKRQAQQAQAQETETEEEPWTLDTGNNTKLYIIAPKDVTQRDLERDFKIFGPTIKIDLTKWIRDNNKQVGYAVYKNKIDAIDAMVNGPPKYEISWKRTRRTEETKMHFLCGDQIPLQVFDDHAQTCSLKKRLMKEKPKTLKQQGTSAPTPAKPQQKAVVTEPPTTNQEEPANPGPCTSQQADERGVKTQQKKEATISAHRALYLDQASSGEEDIDEDGEREQETGTATDQAQHEDRYMTEQSEENIRLKKILDVSF